MYYFEQFNVLSLCGHDLYGRRSWLQTWGNGKLTQQDCPLRRLTGSKNWLLKIFTDWSFDLCWFISHQCDFSCCSEYSWLLVFFRNMKTMIALSRRSPQVLSDNYSPCLLCRVGLLSRSTTPFQRHSVYDVACSNV